MDGEVYAQSDGSVTCGVLTKEAWPSCHLLSLYLLSIIYMF